MTLTNQAAATDATSAADVQDIAALDRLAGQLAPQATLRRYGRQHHSSDSGPHNQGRWQRVLSAVRHR